VTSVRVLLWGVGEIGTRAARMLLGRPDHTIIGAVSHQVGEDVGELVGLQPHGIRVVGSPEALAAVEADICLLATHQRVPDLAPQIEWLLERRIAVIAAGEEMIFPWASHPALADALDRRARAAGRQVYGTGVNPGFVMDALPLVLTSCCASVERIDVTRASDFSPYGPAPLRSLGVGLSPEEFERGLRDGSVDGHIGFRESAGLMARALGWEIDDYREEIKPIVAGVERRTRHITVPPGGVAGCDHWAEALSGGRVVIRLSHPQQVDPGAEQVRVGDFVSITGDPPMTMEIMPEIEGGQATAARMVNAIPSVLDAPPGLRTMDELSLPFVGGRTRAPSTGGTAVDA
jgi:2,4-diaminopentanoate dehydrogenase